MFINDINPILIAVGPITIRYYGVLLVGGMIAYLFITQWIIKREKLSLDLFYAICFYLLLGVIIGARLGYVLFYGFSYYANNPLDVIKIWEGGLSSHGATLGLLISYVLFYYFNKSKFKNNLAKYTDLLVVAMPLAASFVRIGNFINSEIVGRPTDLPWGVVFARLGETVARHPVQIYEFIIAVIIFIILLLFYLKIYKKTKPYCLIFLFVLLYFASRFLIEFTKEFQVTEGSLTMGQYLSIIPVIVALIYFIFAYPRLRK